MSNGYLFIYGDKIVQLASQERGMREDLTDIAIILGRSGSDEVAQQASE
jgi:hypothetical protein